MRGDASDAVDLAVDWAVGGAVDGAMVGAVDLARSGTIEDFQLLSAQL